MMRFIPAVSLALLIGCSPPPVKGPILTKVESGSYIAYISGYNGFMNVAVKDGIAAGRFTLGGADTDFSVPVQQDGKISIKLITGSVNEAWPCGRPTLCGMYIRRGYSSEAVYTKQPGTPGAAGKMAGG